VQTKSILVGLGLLALFAAAAGCGTTVKVGGDAQGQSTVTQTVTPATQPPPPPPATTSASGPAPSVSGLRSCGGNLKANQHTSCPFAESVYSTVALDNGSAVGSYQVYSSVTQQYYTMHCGFEQTRMVCRGGNNAVVSWPS
jgi:serine/threonine-protein kinase